MGESLLAQRETKQAMKAFAMVAEKYPQSPKHAAALLKQGTTYSLLKQYKNAKKVLQRVIDEYPESSSAEQARALLTAMDAAAGAKK